MNDYSKLTNYVVGKRETQYKGTFFKKTWYCADSSLNQVIRMFNREGYSDIEIRKWNDETKRYEAQEA